MVLPSQCLFSGKQNESARSNALYYTAQGTSGEIACSHWLTRGVFTRAFFCNAKYNLEQVTVRHTHLIVFSALSLRRW